MGILVLAAVILGAGFYYLCLQAGYKIVEKDYLSEEATEVRVSRTVAQFQSYVKLNNLTSRDLGKIAEWTMKNGYVNVLVFQNGHPRFEAGSWGADSLEGSQYAKLYEDSASSYTFSPVSFVDGVFQVAIDDYSYVRYYTLTQVISVSAAAIVVLLMVLLYTGRLTDRVKVLSKSAQKIEKGDLDHIVAVSGHDEITRLASCMDNMRVSVNERIQGEYAARKANSDLIAAISHDIRTPLTTLIGYLELLQDNAYSTDEQRGQYTDAAHEKAMRLKELTDELFSYFLVYDSSEIPVNIEEFDGEVLLDQMLGEYAAELRDGGWRVIVNKMREPCTITADVMFLKRVFDNVFSNVRKHGDKDKPVIIMAQIEGDGRLHATVTNGIPAVPNRVESTKVGLKTCEKLMASMHGEFTTLMEDGKYVAEVVVTVKKQKLFSR